MTLQIVHPHKLMDSASLSRILTEVLLTEADAVRSVIEQTSDSLAAAARIIFESKGPLIVSGVGKSGHIARKIASTFSSLGKRAAFLHAAEASHGDLGMIHDDSVVLILSNSGETAELSDLLAYCRQYAIPIISITATSTSTLGRTSQIAIAHGKIAEACVNGLAPTASTTVALALGDALAVGVSHLSGTRPQDFRRYHPGGKLGLRLLKTEDLMHKGAALPVVLPTADMQEVVIEMSRKGFGTAIVCQNRRPIGLITDGDMRRNAARLWACRAADLIIGPPLTIRPDLKAAEALNLMNANGITSTIVTDDDGKLIGLLHIHDCLRAGVGK
ncbi:KpsF/GutQ family sugar-phosphate isomerase [Tabrizicola sp.]|uniref:KpsF/GutQ family sugar-phosphate isomerase n=1 Tax=Tabrizicola sp. TaxID=2005166 RepID=UPI0026030AAE|nr:KpsF/GutQ family sugar-phosphate isomerase [Tabrizicola sp.]MDM7932220.1 KpsF/GutQ family sugar-phosphate isomerase [Tabrizicola sp.]